MKIEILIKRLMKKYDEKNITRGQFIEEIKKAGYGVITIDPNERYVVDGKILQALFDTIGNLMNERKEK